jgi:hypothetical protein
MPLLLADNIAAIKSADRHPGRRLTARADHEPDHLLDHEERLWPAALVVEGPDVLPGMTEDGEVLRCLASQANLSSSPKPPSLLETRGGAGARA